MTRTVIDLGGQWRFRRDPNHFGEHYPDQLNVTHMYDARWMGLDYDDSGWEQIVVPACWQTAGVDYNGVAWYRTRFPNPLAEGDGQRVWLQFEGVDYFADVWLNGRYLGSHEGYFGRFGFDVTPHLRADNQLTVRVDSPREMPGEENEIGQLKNIFKGALERWDVNNTEVSPGGIWHEVKLIVTGPVRLEGAAIQAQPLSLPLLGEPDTAVEALVAVEVTLSLDADQSPRQIDLALDISPDTTNEPIHQIQQTLTLLPGQQTTRFQIHLAQVQLWWTWDLGRPNLYTLQVSATVDGTPSDHLGQRFGIRRIERREGWATYLNNVRFFQRGANYLSDHMLSLMTPERYATDVALLKGANLNTVHPFCLVEKQAFYEACDAAGLLVYQDFPLWLMAANDGDFIRRALRQAEEMIDQFGHHPCIGIWNYGSQPSPANFEKLCAALVETARRKDPTRIIHQANAAFVSSAQNYTDSQRSFFWPPEYGAEIAAQYDWRYDTHLYLGWYSDTFTDLDQVPSEWLQLVTEYGAQALPKRETLESFIEADGLFPPNKAQYARRCCQIERQIERVPLTDTLDQYISATQAYQANFVRTHTEFYRRHKFRPCNGVHLFCFNDCWPAITWAVVEYDRTPKQAYYALQQSMAPLQVLLDRGKVDPIVGQMDVCSIYVVNDYPHPYKGMVRCQIVGPDQAGDISEQPCTVPAGGIVKLDSMFWTPATARKHTIKFTFVDEGEILTTNSYELVVQKGNNA